MKFGCAIPSAHVVEAARMGFDFVELEVPELCPEETGARGFAVLARRLERSGVPASSFRNLLPAHRRIVGPSVDPASLQAYLERVVPRAAELGGAVIVLGSGEARRVPTGFPVPRALEQFATFARTAGDVAGAHGLRIAIEALNRTETNMIHFLGDAAGLADRIGHPCVGVVADVHHMQMEQEPWRAILDARGRLFHVQASDSGRTPPGTRSRDLWAFFTFLRAASYDGLVSIECSWTAFLDQAPRALAFVGEASRSGWEVEFHA
jgi:sugar phosphate isomerase/epimerase